jgi:hypothetical protein
MRRFLILIVFIFIFAGPVFSAQWITMIELSGEGGSIKSEVDKQGLKKSYKQGHKILTFKLKNTIVNPVKTIITEDVYEVNCETSLATKLDSAAKIYKDGKLTTSMNNKSLEIRPKEAIDLKRVSDRLCKMF